MICLTIKTDNPIAEIGLFDGDKKLAYKTWSAHRELAETIHSQINETLKSQKLSWLSIKGIVVFEGPGSFTGLRIGLATANSLAYALDIPIVANSGNNWITVGLKRLTNAKIGQIALPNYGAPVHTTRAKK